MAKGLNTKSQMIMRIAELSEQNSELRTEVETQKQINQDCEIEYRRVVTQYNELKVECDKYKKYLNDTKATLEVLSETSILPLKTNILKVINKINEVTK